MPHQAGQEQEALIRLPDTHNLEALCPPGLYFPLALGVNPWQVPVSALPSWVCTHETPRSISQIEKRRLGLGELAEVTQGPPGAEQKRQGH